MHAAGRDSIYTAFRAVDVLTKYGYITIGSIKTSRLERKDDKDKGISKLEIVVKRTPDFEKLHLDFIKLISEKRLAKSGSGADIPLEKPRLSSSPPGQVSEEAKVSVTPEKRQDGDGGSLDATTSAKSQSPPEKPSQDALSTTQESREKELKKDKWWLKGISTDELSHLELEGMEDEPVLFL